MKSAFVENTVAAMARRSLNHVRILAAALVALLTFGATFIATGAEDADSTINAMSEAHKQFRIPMSNHDLEPRIEAFLVNFFASRSSSDVKSLKVLEEFYADDIMHLSKRIRREIVMNDLRKSSVQWPERSYQMRPQTFRIECFDPTDTVKFPTCKAVGFVDWSASNAAEHVSGVALYDVEMIVHPGAPKIYSQGFFLTQWHGGAAPQVPLPLP